MECPNCKLLNPLEAQGYDWGYDLPSGEMKDSCLTEKQERENKIGKPTGVGAGILTPRRGTRFTLLLKRHRDLPL